MCVYIHTYIYIYIHTHTRDITSVLRSWNVLFKWTIRNTSLCNEKKKKKKSFGNSINSLISVSTKCVLNVEFSSRRYLFLVDCYSITKNVLTTSLLNKVSYYPMVDHLETIAWTFESGLKEQETKETTKKEFSSRHDADKLRITFELYNRENFRAEPFF